MPTAYGYVRVSGREQARSGVGIDAQKKVVIETFERKLAPEGFVLGRIFEDGGIDAATGKLLNQSRRMRFGERRAGAELCVAVRRGDAIVMPNMTRAFGSLVDLRVQIDSWHVSGVRIISPDCLNQEVDTSTLVGKMLLSVIGLGAEMEVELSVERNKARSRSLRANGRVMNQHAPLGLKIVAIHGKKYLQPDDDERMVMAWIARNHDQMGATIRDITRYLGENGVRSRDTMHKGKLRRGKSFTESKVLSMYKAYHHYLKLEAAANLEEDQFVTPDGVIMRRFSKSRVDTPVTTDYNATTATDGITANEPVTPPEHPG